MTYLSEKYGITPEPWSYQKELPSGPALTNTAVFARNEHYDFNEIIADYYGEDRGQANAHVAAKAPDMLKLLEVAHSTLIEAAMRFRHALRNTDALMCSRQADTINALLSSLAANKEKERA